MIDLSPEQLAEVVSILVKFVPECEIKAFGSRVTGGALQYSDLDLAICSDQKINQIRIWQLEEAFSDSDLPFTVDVLDWHDISDQFRGKIDEHCEIIKLST